MNNKKQADFLGLYKTVHDRFERYCRAHAYGDMPYEDLMNESLLIAYKKFNTLKNREAFLSFLIGISIRILANARRKKKAETCEDDTIFNNYRDPNEYIEQQFEVALLHKALAQLPDKQREAIILFEITGFSIKEIMQIQNSNLSAVKQRLVRARKTLAKIIINERKIKRAR